MQHWWWSIMSSFRNMNTSYWPRRLMTSVCLGGLLLLDVILSRRLSGPWALLVGEVSGGDGLNGGRSRSLQSGASDLSVLITYTHDSIKPLLLFLCLRSAPHTASRCRWSWRRWIRGVRGWSVWPRCRRSTPTESRWENRFCRLTPAYSLIKCDHKTSHNDTFLEIKIHASSESWINNLFIDVWFVMIGQYL